MRHPYREHACTHQFCADLLRNFERECPDDELDLLESERDRHGYDLVAIKHTATGTTIRFVQMKSTETAGTDLKNVHSRMLLSRDSEIVQIKVSNTGTSEYLFFSDFGRIAYLCLSIAHGGGGGAGPAQRRALETAVISALGAINSMVPGFAPPTSLKDIQKQWTTITSAKWLPWDGQLRNKKSRLWDQVLDPLILTYKAAFPNWSDGFELNSCWARKIRPGELTRYLFR